MLGDEVLAVGDLRVRTNEEASPASASASPATRSRSRCSAPAASSRRELTLAADPHRTWRFERAADAALRPEVIGLRRAWLARDEK
jgi:hypothetical protein